MSLSLNAIKIQNYARQTEVEEVQALPELITTKARGLSFLILLPWIWSINPKLPNSLALSKMIKMLKECGENKQQEQQVLFLSSFSLH